jgi:hypothetical protein
MGMFTVFVSVIDSSSEPSWAFCVSLVYVKPPYTNPRVPATINPIANNLTAFI